MSNIIKDLFILFNSKYGKTIELINSLPDYNSFKSDLYTYKSTGSCGNAIHLVILSQVENTEEFLLILSDYEKIFDKIVNNGPASFYEPEEIKVSNRISEPPKRISDSSRRILDTSSRVVGEIKRNSRYYNRNNINSDRLMINADKKYYLDILFQNSPLSHYKTHDNLCSHKERCYCYYKDNCFNCTCFTCPANHTVKNIKFLSRNVKKLLSAHKNHTPDLYNHQQHNYCKFKDCPYNY